MTASYFSGLTPFAKLMFALFVIVVCVIVFSIAGILVAIPIFDFNLSELAGISNDLSKPGNIAILKYLQAIQSIGIFILPPFVIGFLYERPGYKYLNLSSPPRPLSLILAVVTIIVALPLINLLAEINSQIRLPSFLSSVEEWMRNSEISAQKITEAFLNVSTTGGLLINLFIVALIPGIGEELLFRGVFQRIFTEWSKNKHAGIIIAAILFSALHLQFYGFFPRMLMGVFFGYLLIWSGSIWVPIAAHFINNTLAVILSYLSIRGVIGKEIESIGNNYETVIFTIFSTLLVIMLIYIIYKKERK